MRSTLLQALLATALTFAWYSAGLDRVPPYLLHDEIKGALQSQSLVDTGRDLNGRRLPLYFPDPGFTVGRDPISIYLTALVLHVRPLSESSIRLPSALVGAAGVGLTFALARLWWPGAVLPWVAAAMLALTPSYFMQSRLGHQAIYPVPFVLLWLICLTLYVRDGRRRQAACSGLALGVGMYSYLAAFITMPVCLAATAGLMAWRRDWRAAGAAAGAFGLMLVPLLLWQFTQPDRYADILTSYGLTGEPGATGRSCLAAIGEAFRLRVDTYWDAFNPSRFFFTGESSLNVSTRQAGILLLPMAVFLMAGIARVLAAPRPLAVVLLAAFLAAPLPAVVMADVEIRRWLVALPFAALLATFGVQTLLASRWGARMAALSLLALLPLQYAGFARDYFTDYPQRAGFWFGGNIRGAVAMVLDRQDAPPIVFIDGGIPWVEAYWRFYVTARGAESLLQRVSYVIEFDEAPAAPLGAAFIARLDGPLEAQLRSDGWTEAGIAAELDGTPSFVVFRKDSPQ
jgi:hypothetical protein